MIASSAGIWRHPAYRAVVRGWPERGLLACSGGVDSSALLVLAGTASQRGDVASFVVVHVDHQTRPESAAEADAVVRLAQSFDLITVRAVVDADSSGESASPEDRLRALRYAALARVARELERDTVVTAHTRDDQVETILMRLLTGAGGLASAGMAARTDLSTRCGSIEIFRPLLDTTRDELLTLLKDAGVTPIIDPTNVDRHYRRNRLRHDIVPALQAAFPGFEPALIRSVTLAARDAGALDGMTAELAANSASCFDDETRVNRDILRSSPLALSTRLIRWAAGRLMPDNQRELTFERIESVREAAAGRTGATIELPYGVVARVERHEIVFERRNHLRDSF